METTELLNSMQHYTTSDLNHDEENQIDIDGQVILILFLYPNSESLPPLIRKGSVCGVSCLIFLPSPRDSPVWILAGYG